MKRRGKPLICQHCRRQFEIAGTKIRPYCSRACYGAAMVALTFRDGQKFCQRCGTWMPVTEFVRNAGTATGYHSYCKPCASVWFHEMRGTPVDQRKPYAPAFRRTEEEKKALVREYGKRRRKTLAPLIAMHNRLRRNRARAAGQLPHPREIGRLLCQQDARCPYCRELLPPAYHVDHKTPVSRGGTNDISNLQVTCPTCNMSKGTKTHEEYIEALSK